MFESTEASPLHSPAESLAALPGSTRPRLRRSRSTVSSSKITLDFPTKTDPSVYLTVRSGNHSAFGAFSPTPDAQPLLQFFATPKRRRPPIPPPMPVRAQTIPSISRTASSFSIAAERSSTPPSASPLFDFDRGYVTPRPIPPSSPVSHSGTPPALASLERRSRFCAKRVFCATCNVPGTNFPSCARCGAAWCSRACRLPNGARHVCPAAPTTSPAPLSRAGISRPPVAIIPAAPIPIPTPSPH
ncbi:hypothetical protein C8F04DRAFT_1110533 [Mycena alexandri]|uniref:HIT-type domain-containing protein n=1 Tax=Mycena alexandri TaxID=1745969 RepID=A0AAD6WXZ8_9AGAR|nr:hypothetical protein C8F04DRAFT_1110533 [Mycena alexandri]